MTVRTAPGPTECHPAGEGPCPRPLPTGRGPWGDAVAVPPGAFAAVDELEARVAAEVRPRTIIAATLVRRFSILSLRLEGCALHDAAMTARRVRYARVARLNERHAEVIAVARRLGDVPGSDPTDAARRLRQTPEGLDFLIREWELLRAEVDAGLDAADTSYSVHDRARMFLGLQGCEQDGGAWAVHCRALEKPSWDATPEEDRAHRDWIAAWAAEQVEGLRRERAALDHAAEEQDRREAATRALFDPGPDAERARRHEANADRSLLRTIRELERIQARAAKEENEAGGGRTPTPANPPGTAEPIAAPDRPAGLVPASVVDDGATPTAPAPAPLPRGPRPPVRPRPAAG